ncbi:MAG: NAD-dependent epimerase/dehydratase family protein [Armatimonadetes bacterium]|nr:NAD-dependent epimerase/dehydratase family protein [Armatimonadota bacterium]
MKTRGLSVVTGATGFVGSALVRSLVRRGEPVRAFGRNRAVLDTFAGGVAGDLRDADAVRAACAGATTVYHVGAFSAPWGETDEFEAVNVGGTRNVLDACRAANVSRIVYVSSPSVTFDGRDCVGQTEAAPYPRRFASVYSRTKKEGEDLVNAARDAGDFETVIVRPKAIFGEGDTSLLPRLLRAAKANRLPIIGTGTNRVDLTHVDNVVHALILAGTHTSAAGKTYTVTNGDADAPRLWDVIAHLLTALGVATPTRHVPLPVALAIAGAAETFARVTRREPFLTRYTANILARTQTYDISAIINDLGYAPVVSLSEGLERTIAAFASVNKDGAR